MSKSELCRNREATPLGSRARDSITGFKGIVTARAVYLHDAPSLRLTAETGQEESQERWISETRCEPDDGEKHTGFGK